MSDLHEMFNLLYQDAQDLAEVTSNSHPEISAKLAAIAVRIDGIHHDYTEATLV